MTVDPHAQSGPYEALDARHDLASRGALLARQACHPVDGGEEVALRLDELGPVIG